MKIIITLFIFLISPCLSAQDKLFSWGVVSTDCQSFLDLVNRTDKYIQDYGDNQIISAQNYYTAVFQAYLSGLNIMVYVEKDSWKNLNFNSEDYLYFYMENYCSKNLSEKISSGLIEYFGELPNA